MFPSIKNRHVIEKTAFEVAYGSEEDAFAQHAALDELVKRRLIKTVEQVFDEVSDSTNVIQLGSLEIDLGIVNYASYADEMDERLRERLRELFRKKMRVEQVGNSQTIGILSEEKSDLVKMKYYLIKGCLPWNAEALDGQVHVGLLERILKNSAKDFLVFLKKTECRDIIISRLVQQFPGKFMKELFGLITNHQEPDLAELVVHLQRILVNSTVFKNMEKEKISNFFWEKLFDALLRKHSSVNSDGILAGIIKAIELISYKTGEKFYRVLMNEIFIFMENTGRKNNLDYIRKRLSSAPDVAETSSHSNIVSEIAQNNLMNINEEIAVKNNEYNKFLPSISFKKQPINYYGEGCNQNKFILISDANKFNNIPYIGQSIQGFPSHRILKNCKKNDEEFFEESTLSENSAAWNPSIFSWRKEEFYSLSKSLLESENKIAENNKGQELNDEDILRACEIYEYILQRLFSIKVDNTHLKCFASLIDELAKISAAHVLKLYREFQVEKPSASQLECRLSSQDLRRLIEVFVDLGQQQDIKASSALLYNINYYADKTIDVNRFYAKIIERISRNVSIDFDEIICEKSFLNKEEYIFITQDHVLNNHDISKISNVGDESKNNQNLIDDLDLLFTADDMRSAIRFFIVSAGYEGSSSYSFISKIEHYSALVINKKKYYGRILECVLLKKYINFKKILEFSSEKINLNFDDKKHDFCALSHNFYYKYAQAVSLLGVSPQGKIVPLENQSSGDQYLIGSNAFTPEWRSMDRPTKKGSIDEITKKNIRGNFDKSKKNIKKTIKIYYGNKSKPIKLEGYLDGVGVDTLQVIMHRAPPSLNLSNYKFFQKKSSIDRHFYNSDGGNQIQLIFSQAGYSKYLELTHRYYKFFENDREFFIEGRLITDKFYKGGDGDINTIHLKKRVNERLSVQPVNKCILNYFLKVRNSKIGVIKNAYEFLSLFPVHKKTILNKLVDNKSNQSIAETSGLIALSRKYISGGFPEDLSEIVVCTPSSINYDTKKHRLAWPKLFLVENIISTCWYVGNDDGIVFEFEDITSDEIFTAIKGPEVSYLIENKFGIYSTQDKLSESLFRESFEVSEPSVAHGENAIFSALPNNDFSGVSILLTDIDNDTSDKFGGASIVASAHYLKDASKIKYENIDRESKNGPDYVFNNRLNIEFHRHVESDSAFVEKNMPGMCNVIWRINKKIDDGKSVSAYLVDLYEVISDKKPVTIPFDSLSYCFYKIRNKCLSSMDNVIFSLGNRKINFEFSSKKIDVKINDYSNNKNSVSEVKINEIFQYIFPVHAKNNYFDLNYTPRNVDSEMWEEAETICDKFSSIIKKSVESSAEFNEDATPGQLIRVMDYILSTQSRRLFKTLPPRLRNRRICERLIEVLPERQLTRILLLLKAEEYRHVQLSADMIVQACYGYRPGIKFPQLNSLKWRFIFCYLFEESRSFDEELFVVGLTDYLSKKISYESNEKFRSGLCQRLAMNILPSTRDLSLRFIKILSATVQPVNDFSENFDVSRSVILPNKKNKPLFQSSEQIYIANAGQVLVAPYLTRLFRILNLMDQSVFRDRIAAERAVHLLQFMVNERVDAPEHQLVLNKILCGIDPGLPIKKEIQIYDHEIELVESLLQAVIKAWSGIGNTSISGLREIFFQRQGRLYLKGDAWQLQVEKKSFDMLLDKIPWNYSVIKLPWMERVIYVDWR